MQHDDVRAVTDGLSPWVRGTPTLCLSLCYVTRFIPVGTGNALAVNFLLAPRPVYPRGYGERTSFVWNHLVTLGLSPWVRGTRRRLTQGMQSSRFIPVGTGNATHESS